MIDPGLPNGSLRQGLRPIPIPPTTRGYRVVLADPPWHFDLHSAKGGEKSPRAQYRCMGFADLVAFGRAIGLAPGARTGRWATTFADQCALVLWATWPVVARGDHVGLMREWGFTPKTGGSWTKQTRTGKLGFGTGFILRSASEPWLIGTRGAPPIASKSERGALLDEEFLADHNGLVAERGAHSVKPPELHALIERLFPRGPYLELFARRPHAGWDCYGDEIGGFVPAEEGRDAA